MRVSNRIIPPSEDRSDGEAPAEVRPDGGGAEPYYYYYIIMNYEYY